jgi:aminoglycoside 6'-N-acetyltransferase
VIVLSPLTEDDVPRVAAWLQLPHVARWWLADTTAEEEIGKYRQRIGPESKPTTRMLLVSLHDEPIGWCQWYRWADYPAEAAAMEACDGEAGIDYAIGDPARIGHGAGTMLVAALAADVRRHHPGAGIVAGPDAANVASRRVLEKNDFYLVAERSVATEPTDRPIAIYRLPATSKPSR